jgi:transcriptional regulator with XRE-family HTH domain
VAGPPAEIEQRLRDLGAFIREQRRGTQLSLRKLAARAGVSNPYLSQIERGLRKPSAEILQAIARALQISAETLYVRAGILDRTPENPATEQAILADATLGEREKQTLLEVYRSLQRTASDPAAGFESGPRHGSAEGARG